MDVDKLFKLPKLPASSVNKRKWAEPSNDALKAAQVEDVDDQEGADLRYQKRSNAPARSARASNFATEDDAEGPHLPPNDEDEFAPGNDADYFVDEDDEGGRFFGGGLTDQQKRIIEIMNSGDGDDEEVKPEQILRDLKRSLLKCERAVNRNAELRVKYSDDPEKFVESEADLDSSLKALVVLTTNPALLYPEAIKNELPKTLCDLLSHENVDIVAAVIELVEELTDDDVLDAGVLDEEDEQDGGSRQGEAAVAQLVNQLLDRGFLDLLIPNLTRLSDEAPEGGDATAIANAESDANTIYHMLGALENLLSLKPTLARHLADSTLLGWLLERAARKGKHDQNRGYAAELLAVLVQSQEGNYVCQKLGEKHGIDDVLQLLSRYRKTDPADDEETEFVENVFDILCAALSSLDKNQTRFYRSEGTELMCIFLKEKRPTRLRAIKVLDYALSGTAGAKACETFVESMGLAPLFSMLMGRGFKKANAPTASDEEHMLGVVVSLFNNLASDSQPRIRLLAKFVEDEYAKVDRLLEMSDACSARLKGIDKEIAVERQAQEADGSRDVSLEEELFYLRRLDAGLHSLQHISYIIAWLCMEDDGVAAHLRTMLSRKGHKLDGQIVDVLKEWYEHIGEDAVVAEPIPGSNEPALLLQDVIIQLVNYMLGIA
ncbi:Uncharacterized conserved protein [Ceraceosorus bombacis]|uniref:Uncharacterized conserved protein n=1 Tax=Ceraceosorus bombacis TaxID=401625 RepID=A0A0N7L8Z5_9BASI|nr:Uncharacterized conserved protein [Ceraceosorus bombacis]